MLPTLSSSSALGVWSAHSFLPACDGENLCLFHRPSCLHLFAELACFWHRLEEQYRKSSNVLAFSSLANLSSFAKISRRESVRLFRCKCRQEGQPHAGLVHYHCYNWDPKENFA